jgi:hypothetical protein
VIAAREGLKLSDEAGLGGAVRARFLDLLGWKASMQGDRERAKELLEECLKLRRDAKDELGIADALLGLGCSLECQNDRKRGRSSTKRASLCAGSWATYAHSLVTYSTSASRCC